MKTLTTILLLISSTIFAQERGEVFPHTPKTPTEQVYQNGKIEVSKSMYGLTFKDETIPTEYKKAVEIFFKQNLKTIYKPMKTYTLKVAKKYGYIWIEGKRVIKHS